MVNRHRLVLLMLVTAVSAYADKAGDAYKHGAKAERKADLDSAYAYYKDAFNLKPKDPRYITAYMRVRFAAGAQHTRKGQDLLVQGKLAEASTELQQAVAIDPSNFMAQQELRRATDMIRRKERQLAEPKQEAIKLSELVKEPLELQPLSASPITLHLTANADVAYKTICKLAGLNVLMDPDYHAQKITVDLNDVTIREALDMVRLQSKTYWHPVLANTIFVTADSPGKRKELEQNVLRTFHLRNLSTPAELQEAANVVKQVLDVTRVTLLQAQDELIVRGTPDQLLLAEKLLSDMDKPKPEVVIDVAVMQVARNKTLTLGAIPPTSVSVGYLGSNAASGAGSGSTVNIGTFSVSVSSAAFTSLLADSNSKVIQRPQVRALNDEKATLRIGDRIPIATGSFQPTVAGAGAVNALISTQFQYIDVGVNIDITPHIHNDREVTLKLSLEVSAVDGNSTIGGITQPTIGQRRVELDTRVLDGEVNLVGGILDDQESHSMSGLPWVSKIPILKYLFAQDTNIHNQDEIVFAITPHIMRAPEFSEEDSHMIEVGTGSSIELRRKQPASTPASTPDHPADPTKPKESAPQQPAPSTTPVSVTRPGAVQTQPVAQSRPGAPQ